MVLLPTLVSSLLLLCSDVGLANNGGRRRQQQKTDVENTKDLWDLIVIFLDNYVNLFNYMNIFIWKLFNYISLIGFHGDY